MSNRYRRLLSVFIIFLAAVFLFAPAHAQEDSETGVVRAVLFYSPTCPHCEEVIQNVLPPILAEYGDQLKIVAVNVTLPGGQELYQAAIKQYAIPEERFGVPTLIINDVVMVGGEEIPTQFPGIVASALAGGGTDWPEIPGLAAVIVGVEFSSQPSGSPQTGGDYTTSLSMLDKFKLDPVANTIAVIVLIIMLASVVGVLISFTRPVPEKDFWPKWVVPLISIAGMGVAFYMTYVESSGAEAVCGPVGDCNTVQLSPYATLFGFLPVGVLGLIGYALLLVAWAVYTFGPQSLRWTSAIAVWGMAFFGVLFSIYLTFLEPFVIGASCMWCISSAIFQTVIFLAATGPAKRAWQEDDFDDEDFEDDEYIIPDTDGELPEDLSETQEQGEDKDPVLSEQVASGSEITDPEEGAVAEEDDEIAEEQNETEN